MVSSDELAEHLSILHVLGQDQFVFQEVSGPESKNSESIGSVTLHFFENLLAEGNLLAINVIHGLPLFFAKVHRMEVHEVRLVELKNFFQSFHFLLHVLFECFLFWGFIDTEVKYGSQIECFLFAICWPR